MIIAEVMTQFLNFQDIEDLVGAAGSSSSIYFSPIRTRKQRQINGESLKMEPLKMESLKKEPLSPTRVPPKKNKKEDHTVTKIQVGSATVVKCKVVQEAAESPIRIDKIKKEMEPQIKQELNIQESLEALKSIKTELVNQLDPNLYPEVQAPHPLWYNHLENIRIMRNSKSAPVDTMGCHRCADSKADAKVFLVNRIQIMEYLK